MGQRSPGKGVELGRLTRELLSAQWKEKIQNGKYIMVSFVTKFKHITNYIWKSHMWSKTKNKIQTNKNLWEIEVFH